MRDKPRHPRLTAVACKVYGLTIWTYPVEFRREYGRELVMTFRNQVEDLDAGDILDWLTFTVHIAADWIHTVSRLFAESRRRRERLRCASREAYAVHGWFERASLGMSIAFASGVGLSGLGCYAFILYLLSYARQ